VRVGQVAISKAAVDHWMVVFAPQHIVLEPPGFGACVGHLQRLQANLSHAQLLEECARQYRAVRQQALGFLISADWLSGEAGARGSGVSDAEVRQSIEKRRASFPNGEAEFQESLKAISHTQPDLELEIRSELAAQKLRRSLQAAEPQITQAQIAAYYKQHIGRYHLSERRRFYIVENLKSAAAARRLAGEMTRGRSIAQTSLNESYQRSEIAQFHGEKRTILEAIFAAKPHVIAKPVELNHLYFLVEVTHVTPARLRPLAEVRQSIARKLVDSRRRRSLARFVNAWRKKWVARTDCQPVYVVQKCRQYRGPAAPEDPLKLD
jgi:hypothetical protein